MGVIHRREADALILALIERSEGFKPGKTHIQKEMFVVQKLCNVRLPYDFVIYDYGPYSFDLADALNTLLAIGFVDDVSKTGDMGSRFVLTDEGRNFLKSQEEKIKGYYEALDEAWDLFSGVNVGVLELAATTIYVIKELGIQDEEKAVGEVRKIKPQYSEKKAKEFYKITYDKVIPHFEKKFA